MNKQFILSVVVLFIWTMIVGYVIHVVLLGPDYAAVPDLFRPESESQGLFGYMLAGHLSMAFGLTWIYRRGREDKPWLLQGVRFGVALVLLMGISIYLIYYAVQPIPEALVHKQIIFESVGGVLTGIVTAFVNK